MSEIYASENGDTWHLLWDFETGHTFVRHTANKPSGGNIADISLPAFLSLDRDGPEHQALWAMIDTLADGRSSVEPHPAPEVGAAAAEPSPGGCIFETKLIPPRLWTDHRRSPWGAG